MHRKDSDEIYVIDLVAAVLNELCVKQKRFETLFGDPNLKGQRAILPVDAFFPNINLIVEYREIQHYKAVKIMDQRMTISGVPRGEQRRIYDLRKEKWAAEHNITFLAISFENLKHNSSGRLLRHVESDTNVIKKLVKAFK